MTNKSLPDRLTFGDIRGLVPLKISHGGLRCIATHHEETGLMLVYGHGGLLECAFVPNGGAEILATREGPSEPLHISMHRSAERHRCVSVCYFIGGDTGPIKIGHSVDVASRLKALRLSSPMWLRVFATCAGGEPREAAYHQQFAAHRLHGEWFVRHPDILAEIDRLNQSLSPTPAPIEGGSL